MPIEPDSYSDFLLAALGHRCTPRQEFGEAALAAEVLRRETLPRSGTVRCHLETNPDVIELCLFFNPENCTWTAYPVGGIFSRFEAPDHVSTATSPEAAVAAALNLEVLP